MVLPGDVNIASIINTADGVEFLLYVLIGGGLQVLTPSSLEATLDVCILLHSMGCYVLSRIPSMYMYL